MGSYTGLAESYEADSALRVLNAGVNLSLTQEEAQELFERVLSAHAEDTPASARALRKLAGAIRSAASAS